MCYILDSEDVENTLSVLTEVDTSRFFWKASGYINEDLDRPVVAIANSMQDAGVGHVHLRELAKHVKESVYSAGGTPIEFNVIGPCAGYARTDNIDDTTFLYDLPQRDVIADSIEIQMENYAADGLVCMGTCDKIVPGMWLGASRLNLPTVFLVGGPAQPGEWRGEKTTFPSDIVIEGLKEVLTGQMTKEEFLKEVREKEDSWIRSCGACPELTTANTTMIATEAMGLSLPKVSTTLGNDMAKTRQARKTGHAIMDLIEKNITFDEIVTKEAIEDAYRCIMAISGSTNAILHLLTLSISMNLDLSLEKIQEISDTTPLLAPIRPFGEYTIADFHDAGGVIKLLENLPKTHEGRKTVAGKTIKQNIEEIVPSQQEVIQSSKNPIQPTGAIKVLKGNLAPKGSLTRVTTSQLQDSKVTGEAKCYDKQIDAITDILNNKVQKGDVLVIRFQGPRGAPGFSENFEIVLLLDAINLENVAVITDGRFSGATKGPLYIGYVSPEAYVGGPLAAVREGDEITIDLDDRRVDLNLSEEEIEKRLEDFEPPEPRIKEGVLVDWNKTATQFHEGAMLRRKLE